MTLTITGTYLLILWSIVTFTSWRLTRDIASPQMMFCASLFVFFFDIFLSQHSIYMYGTYILSLLIVLISSFFNQPRLFETQLTQNKFIFNKDQLKPEPDYKLPKIAIWLMSIPSILSMLYMINMFGGIEGYIVAAQHGTKFFYGLGPLKTMISTLYPISLYYFALLISKRNPSKEYFIFSIHFLILLALALLSLSRGTLLTHLVFMMLIWHFVRKQVTAPVIVLGLAFVLSFASIYGVVRETLAYEDGSFSTGLEDQEVVYKSEWMVAGIFPFERIIDAKNVNKHWGSTYVTIVTNFVPRSIWPGKPAPGGVIFTNEYASEFYDEYSHFTSGLYPEAMMNFGRPAGIVIGALQLALICFLISLYYRKILFKTRHLPKNPQNILSVVIYVYVAWASVMLLTGEITSIFVNTIIRIIVLIFIFYITQIRLNPRNTNNY